MGQAVVCCCGLLRWSGLPGYGADHNRKPSRPLLRCIGQNGHGELDLRRLLGWWFCGGLAWGWMVRRSAAAVGGSGGAQAAPGACVRWTQSRRPAAGPEELPLARFRPMTSGLNQFPEGRPQAAVWWRWRSPEHPLPQRLPGAGRCLGRSFSALHSPVQGRGGQPAPPPFAASVRQDIKQPFLQHRSPSALETGSALLTSRLAMPRLLEGLALAISAWCGGSPAGQMSSGTGRGRLVRLRAPRIPRSKSNSRTSSRSASRGAPAQLAAAIPHPQPEQFAGGSCWGRVSWRPPLRWATLRQNGRRPERTRPGSISRVEALTEEAV